MLAADKELLTSELKKKAIAIQNLELNFFVTNLGTVATTASMLAGFSYSALLTTDTSFGGVGRHWEIGLICFYFSTTMAMGSEMLALILATVCRLWGVGLALRGPAGSMRTAVDAMAQYQTWAVRFFATGMVCFHISAITYTWISFSSWLLAALVSLMLLASIATIAFVLLRVKMSFGLAKNLIVRGNLDERFVQGLEDTSLLHHQIGAGRMEAGYGNGPYQKYLYTPLHEDQMRESPPRGGNNRDRLSGGSGGGDRDRDNSGGGRNGGGGGVRIGGLFSLNGPKAV